MRNSSSVDGAHLRIARVDDAPAVLDIYAPFVTGSAVSFETDLPDLAEVAHRIAAAPAWLVAEDARGRVLGYASASPWRPRAAYAPSVEVSAYLAEAARGQGLGPRLVTALLQELRARGFANAFAQITRPNTASEQMFEQLGFRLVGVMEAVGHKLDAWHDVAVWQLRLEGWTVPDADPIHLLS